ncbi:hypothetical protein JHL17_05385 [Azospirillum sp. YIM B02556]|uniref:Uncharacterized protein n=1 Tax=Azospirillum endophyticum TaxID=2800326 RepID=A0ABS1F094_9PROT|nr:hypothetical protein [Azospirillum endophyticum]MBK1836840.1 hypothetical protein [Azospirillum endophyticum]
MMAIIRKPLKAVVTDGAAPVTDNPLLAYSQGRLARSDAVQRLGLRDYAGLLVALGDAALPIPLPSPRDVENQVTAFAELWTQS